MKRKFAVAVSLALASTGCIMASLLAQGPGGGAGGYKAAVVNIDAVFVKYEKAKTYKKELDDTIAPYKGEAEKYKDAMVKIADYLKTPAPKDREKYEKAILEYRRKLEDLDREVRKLIGKKQEDQLVVLYKEVVEATKLYAKSNGIAMVYGYGEPFEGNEVYGFGNISRKMQGMGLGIVPIWYDTSCDITDAVITTLNYNYKPVQGNVTGGNK